MFSLPVRKLISIFILLLSLVSTSVYFLQKQNFETRTRAESSTPISQTSQKTKPTTKIYTVTYQNSKFNPEKITIKFGDSVTWVNKSTNKLWVASGPHPSHALYPEFDSKEIIELNQSFTFTFTKKGYWGYHNHTNDDTTGLVIVE